MIMQKDMSLKLSSKYIPELDIPIRKYAKQRRARLDVNNSSYLHAKKVKCPLFVERLYDYRRDGEDMEPLLDVCYTDRDKKESRVIYKECQMSTKPCTKIGKIGFGHYKSIDDAYEGFLRCMENQEL